MNIQIGKYTLNGFGNVCWIDLDHGRWFLNDEDLYLISRPVVKKVYWQCGPFSFKTYRRPTEQEMESVIDELRRRNK
jgi:hypothetical protein